MKNKIVFFDLEKTKYIFKELKDKGVDTLSFIKRGTRRFIALLGVLGVLASPAFADTVQTTGGNSYVRSGPGTSFYDFGHDKMLFAGKTGHVIVKDDELGWYIVATDNSVGYVCADYLKITSEGPSIYDITPLEEGRKHIHQNVDSKALNIRSGPGTEFSKVSSNSEDMIKPKEYVYVYGQTANGWDLVRTYEGLIGYSYAENLWETIYDEMPEPDYSLDIIDTKSYYEPEYVYVTGDGVNLRKTPDNNSKNNKSVNKGTKLKLVNKDDYWNVVLYDNNYYYISSEFLAWNPLSQFRDDFICVVAAKEKTYLRKSNNANSEVIYTISKYETCEVLGVYDDYLKVRVDKFEGYVENNSKIFEKLTGLFGDIDKGNHKLTIYNDDSIVDYWTISTARKGCITPDGKAKVGSKYEEKRMYSPPDKYNYDVISYYACEMKYIGVTGSQYEGIYEHEGDVKVESHGCIHSPKKKAKWFYSYVPSGTVFYFHN